MAILNIIDDAENAHPRCGCGAPMVAGERDGALWLVCSAPRVKRSRLGRLASLDWMILHDRRLLLDAEELLAA